MPSDLSYYELPEFLDSDTKSRLLQIGISLKDEDWTVHKSTRTGKASVLNFYDLNMTFHGRNCYLLMIRPQAIQDWHTDGGKRNTALIYPLSENYAPCSFEQGQTDRPMFLNTQSKHAVFNNDEKRINLNISFEEDIDDCIEFFKCLEFFKGNTAYEFDPS